MNIIRYISRILIGVLFIFSGTVKAIDPLGTAYKFHDYFQAFHITFLDSFCLPLTILLCTAEFIGGISVMFNIRFRTGIWIVLLLMLIFTPLTFILALTNPVSDCGCFGDAIHLTNWQTFLKNILIIIPVIFLFITRKEILPHKGITREWVTISIIIIIFFAFIFYNLRYLPVIDFLPYKTGTYIPEKIIIPEGKQADKYETSFIYEKNGERKEFSLENYPANDSTWKFVDQKSVLVSKGYQPPIHDFNITTMNGDDITNQILSSKKHIVLMVSKKLDEADQSLLRKGFELGYYCMVNNIDFYILTASGSAEIKSFDNGLQFYRADETTLKTMIRANPGYILIKEGTIIAKWSWANLPEKEKVIGMINKQ